MEPIYERFRKQQPPSFNGSMDPFIAEEWLSRIAMILEFMNLNDPEKVLCAVYMLTKDARYWWDVVKKTNDV